MAARNNRRKISTTVSKENDEFLRALIEQGKVASLAEAVDRVVTVARRAAARKELERATAAYFDSLAGENLAEENRLSAALSESAGQVNFDE